MYKIYKVYMADYDRTTGEDIVFVVTVPAESEEAACEYVEGNGEIIKMKEVTSEYPIDIAKVYDALWADGFGKCERDIVTRVLSETLVNTK